MKPDQERVKTLLADTVTLLCRNGLHFQHQLRVQGVLGITVDDSDVFIVHINESFTEQVRGAKLADFQGPLGSSFTASLVASLSGNIGNLAPPPTAGTMRTAEPLSLSQVNSGAVAQQLVGRQAHTNPKHKTEVENCGSPLKRAKPSDGLQYGTSSSTAPDIKSGVKDAALSQQHAIAVPVGAAAAAAHWQQQQQDRMRAGDVTACYLGYATGGSVATVSSAASALTPPATGKRKANVYPPPQSMLAMSFGNLASTVDYGSGILQATGQVQSINNVQPSQADIKLWTEAASQHVVQQQARMNADEQQRLGVGATAAAVFDPLTGCATWTVQHLMDGQGLQGRSDNQQQQQSQAELDEKYQIHDLNPLGIIYAADTGEGDTASLVGGGGGETSSQRKQRSKESRRSWTSKHKPYACRHPGCRRSYFFVHDLRRHLRQKHNGMDYNEESGQYEVAVTDDPIEQHPGDSPSSPHDDSDDQSPDTDDEVSMATATLVG